MSVCPPAWVDGWSPTFSYLLVVGSQMKKKIELKNLKIKSKEPKNESKIKYRLLKSDQTPLKIIVFGIFRC